MANPLSRRATFYFAHFSHIVRSAPNIPIVNGSNDSATIVAATGICIQIGTPVLLWGPPGQGKSKIVESIAAALGRPIEVVIGSLRDATDFAGLPMRSDNGVVFAPPRWALRTLQAPTTVVFLDELTTAPPQTQAAMLRVVLEREVAELRLPHDVSIVGAANPVDCGAGVEDLSPALANRFVHLDYKASAADWATGFLDGWSTGPSLPVVPPITLPDAGWRSLVAGFLRRRPDLLTVFPDNIADQGRAWPSPRTWEMAATLCSAADAALAGDDVGFALARGAVGEAAAIELVSYREQLDLVDPEILLAQPSRWCPPTRDDQALVVLSAVVDAVATQPTQGRWEAAWAVLVHACETGAVDIAATAAGRLVELRQPGWPILATVRRFRPVLERADLL